MTEHTCTRIGNMGDPAGFAAFVECACGWATRCSGPSKSIALTLAVDKFADHAVVQAGTDAH